MGGREQHQDTPIYTHAHGYEGSKPQSLLHAISEIEQWSFIERSAKDIDPQVVTTPIFITFVLIGWRAAFISFLFAFLTLPFSYMVTKQVIPIFGSYNPSLGDKIYAYAISTGHTVVLSLFLAKLFSRCYLGSTTKRAITALVWEGIVAAKWICTFFGFILYHLLYYFILTPSNIQRLAGAFSEQKILAKISLFLSKFFVNLRIALIPSAWTLVLLALLQTLILGLSYWYAHRRTKKIQELYQKWQV